MTADPPSNPENSPDRRTPADGGAASGGGWSTMGAADTGTWSYEPQSGQLTLSTQARRLFGLPEDHPVKTDAILPLLDPADQGRMAQAIQNSVQTGVQFDLECRITTTSGQKRWLRLLGALLRDAQGAPDRLGGFVLDNEASKSLEAALQNREEHFRSILDTVPDAMTVIDERGIIQFFSSAAERQFGYSALEAIGRNISMLMPEPDRGRHDSYIARYLGTGERHIIGIGRIVTGLRRDGTTFPLHLTIGEMSSSGRPYFTGFMRDLTTHQQTEARLQELQAELVHMSRLSAMGEMASALAHELNQPLAAIANYMKGSRRLLASSADPNAARIEGALDRAAEQALRAGDIIRRLRTFVSREESEKRVESVSKLIEEAGALGLSGAREQGVILRFNLDPDADQVLADRVQVQQVLVNLFRNALEAMAHSPHRELIASNRRAAEDMIEISVSDTGHGFSEDALAKLFTPFFTTKATGMGVGLSISRTIIEAHGGKMWAETNTSGGATFHLTLPDASVRNATHGR